MARDSNTPVPAEHKAYAAHLFFLELKGVVHLDVKQAENYGAFRFDWHLRNFYRGESEVKFRHRVEKELGHFPATIEDIPATKELREYREAARQAAKAKRIHKAADMAREHAMTATDSQQQPKMADQTTLIQQIASPSTSTEDVLAESTPLQTADIKAQSKRTPIFDDRTQTFVVKTSTNYGATIRPR